METNALISIGKIADKSNLVQEILSGSLQDDNQNSLYARLHPSIEVTPYNAGISVLTDHLILTSAANVVPNVIDALGVTCVISAAPELPDIPLADHIIYHRVEISDSPNSNISCYLDETIDLIDHVASVGGRTLVFCVAGVSRSATICIAYLMKFHTLSLLGSYNYIKMRRSRIKPNCGFFKQLIEFEKKMFIISTVQMVFNEFVQMNIPDVYDNEYRVVRRLGRKLKNNNYYRNH